MNLKIAAMNLDEARMLRLKRRRGEGVESGQVCRACCPKKLVVNASLSMNNRDRVQGEAMETAKLCASRHHAPDFFAPGTARLGSSLVGGGNLALVGGRGPEMLGLV